MSLDISNKLTFDGLKCIFEKLFDPLTTYNKAFFSSIDKLLPLRLYNGTDYKESYKQSYLIENNTIVIQYRYKGITQFKFTAMRIYNKSVLMMEDTDFAIPIPNLSIENEVIVELTFSLKEITQCIPKVSLMSMTQSLMNENNRKITRLFTGSGLPDLSGDSPRMTSKVTSYPFTKVIGINQYLSTTDNDRYVTDTNNFGINPIITDFISVQLVNKGRSIKITVKANDAYMMKDINELGVGYNYVSGTDNPDSKLDVSDDGLNPVLTDSGENDSYILCTLQQVHFSKINQSDKYIIELVINIW